MTWQDRLVVDPAILTGQPVIKGTRIAVEFILELLAQGWGHEQIERNYPPLTDEDLQAALHYARMAFVGSAVRTVQAEKRGPHSGPYEG